MALISRREFAGALAPAALAAPPRPNVVYILADDLGWGDLGCYNAQSAIPTPNADGLARQGLRFTDMHSPSSVCTPTRYGVLTGRYCWRTRLKSGVLWGYSPNLIEPGRLTVASMLQSRGYSTAGIGKWHLGLGDREKTDYSRSLKPGPRDHGFDYYFGIPASLDMDPYLYIENDRAVEQPAARTEGSKQPRGVFWRPGPIAPGFKIDQVLPTLTSKAVSFLREQARATRPFFLYLALTAPHTPWAPLERFRGRSKAGDYGDFAAQVDDSLGQVLRALDETGAAANTLVIFTSDNGADWNPQDKQRFEHRANAQWRGRKADVWEAGHRIPFLARWPGRIRPGSTSGALGCLTDFLATAAEAIDYRLPQDAAEDSFSLLPVLLGKKPEVREAVVHHSSEGMFAIRQGGWKLAAGLGSGGFSDPKKVEGPGGQLYDLTKDPGETENLYAKRPEIVARLTALLEKYQREGRSR